MRYWPKDLARSSSQILKYLGKCNIPGHDASIGSDNIDSNNDVSDHKQHGQKDFSVEDSYIFDTFFDPWWENTDAATLKQEQNSPEQNKSSDACKGSKSRITIAREILLQESLPLALILDLVRNFGTKNFKCSLSYKSSVLH